ncbi:MAG: type II toxin-antitoxin system HicB family antitoxin [Candidatus Wolfebacteria bacterium]|nr:type II toxin-antitoxin system HicB family antitoxin [Candidatus Wolfebacteria bacterium]
MKKITKEKSKNLSFPVVYEADPEGGYVVSIPTLPGCRSQGETLEEAESRIKEAAVLYLESLFRETGKLPKDVRTFQGRIEVAV